MMASKLLTEVVIGSALVPMSAAKSVALLSLPRLCLLTSVYLLRTPFIRDCCLASHSRNWGFTLWPGISLCQQTTQATVSLPTQHMSGRLPLPGTRLFCITATAFDFCACCLVCAKVLHYDANYTPLRSHANEINILLGRTSGVRPSRRDLYSWMAGPFKCETISFAS